MVKDNKIALMEIFKSIDGEAFHSGQTTVFVRTFGCCCRCTYCDTSACFSEEVYKSVYGHGLLWMSTDEIFDKVEELEKDFKFKSICLTGGEPFVGANKNFMLNSFLPKFLDAGYAVNVETCGAVDYADYKEKFGEPELLDGYGNRRGLTLITDWKLPCSGMNQLMFEDNLKILSENDVVKFVISDSEEDWKELVRVLELHPKAKVYLSPVFGQVSLNRIPEFVFNNPQYNVTAQVQAHKIFWDPNKIGV